VSSNKRIVWNKNASQYFKRAIQFIQIESPQNAEKVRMGIVKMIDDLSKNPEMHPPDKYKKNNRGQYRAFEKYSYRVSYVNAEFVIKILRIRHVKQEPKGF
jgi:plasmid stabilization system protein ParE